MTGLKGGADGMGMSVGRTKQRRGWSIYEPWRQSGGML